MPVARGVRIPIKKSLIPKRKKSSVRSEKNHIGAKRRRLSGCHPLRPSVKWQPPRQGGGFRHHLVFLLLSWWPAPAGCGAACCKFDRALPGAVPGLRRQCASQHPRLICRWAQ